jgi:alkylhydroperoxidase/carboxymuconolactone decarboxylase family protein YurZ
MSDDEIRYDPVVVATFREIWGPDFLPPFPRLAEASEAMAPIAAAQGAIFANPILDLKLRAVIVFSTLVALGFQPETKLYIQGLRNLGYTVREISEMIAQISLYAGMPRGIDANMLMREVVEEDDDRARTEGFFYRFPRETHR